MKAAGRLVDMQTITHSYPFCWRSETPLIYKVRRARGMVAQWGASAGTFSWASDMQECACCHEAGWCGILSLNRRVAPLCHMGTYALSHSVGSDRAAALPSPADMPLSTPRSAAAQLGTLTTQAVPSWFIRVEAIKPQLLACNAATSWVPSYVKEKRFQNWLETAHDWAVSRSRFWGTPLPIWTSADGAEVRVIGSVAELEAATGALARHPTLP